MKLHLDFETRSELDLRVVGAWKYAMHESTEIMCATLHTPGQKPRLFRREQARDLANLDLGDDIVYAHNAAFEFAIWHCIVHKRFGGQRRVDPKLWSCTMARAAMVGLPLDLDMLGRVLKIKTPKDLEGRRVMLQLCKPKGYDALGEVIWDETPEKYERLYVYNGIDVQAEEEIDLLLPEQSPEEKKIWDLDLIANARGVAVDLDVCRKASALAGELTKDLNARLRELTSGKIDKATQTLALKVWIKSQGVDVPTKTDKKGKVSETIDKSAILGLLANAKVPQNVKDVVTIRQQVGKSSTAKYFKALETAGPDSRVRGVLQYHAAHTGRWGGRLIQPQNYPKGFETPEEQARCLDMLNDPDLFLLNYGTGSMSALADGLRGTIVAGPKKILVAADYNAIEARINFWLAGEESALATYRRGGSPYFEMGEEIFGKPITKKDKYEYAVAKETVLGAGFQMWVDRFIAQCAGKNPPVIISPELAEKAIRGFRSKYSCVPRNWKATQAAAISAVKNPGTNYATCDGKVLWGMSVDRRFLKCRLPSGRFLWYWNPLVQNVWRTYCKDEECPHFIEDNAEKCPARKQEEQLCYWGEDPKTHQWVMLATYGGALVENVTQAVARDIMAHGMLNSEANGFPLLFTCHDENISEIYEISVRDSTLGDFIELLCDVPEWAKTCPIAAEGWIGHRYRK